MRSPSGSAPPRSNSSLPAVARYLGSAAGGLAAGAAAAHLLYTQGHRIGLDLRVKQPLPEPAPDPTPEDYDQADPGRGRLAQRPEHIPHKGWVDILWRVGVAYMGDRVSFVAGGVTFFTLLSLFPLLASFVTLYGLFADPANASERLQFLYALMPANVAEFLAEQMQRLAVNSSGQLTFTLIWTLALSLWTANGGTKTMFYGLNVAYHEVEKRNFVRYNLVCMAFTLSGIVGVLVLTGLVIGIPLALALFGLQQDLAILNWARWPVLFAGYVMALSIIYRNGPCRAHARWRWLTLGALFAATISLTLSVTFSWYLANFVKTDSYGPLAAFMGFLLWIWLTIQVLLVGAELNAEVERQTAIDTTTGKPSPLGTRGATVADTVGPCRQSPTAFKAIVVRADKLRRRGKTKDQASQ